jgi:uncharacterized protein (TIGR01777 family)
MRINIMVGTNNKYVAMTGATGFVGKKLQRNFGIAGYKIIALTRSDFQGEPEKLAAKISKAQAVINLAGAPVISRWTEQYKKTLYDSRVTLTKKLIAAISLLETKPETLISTSAIGIYAAEGTHTEEHYVLADNFLGKLALDWEEAALKAEDFGVRTTIFRLGVVLGKNGGALKKMMLPFKLGLGGIIGSGEQHFSWIHIADVIAAYESAFKDSSYSGIYNLTAQEVTTNRGFTKELGRTLSRPTILPVPGFILKGRFGEGAQVLTSGQNAYPKRLLDAGFPFQFVNLRDALKNCV